MPPRWAASVLSGALSVTIDL
jgi:hypothetical protein